MGAGFRDHGLDKRLDGNILLVAQAKELADLEEQKLQGQKKVEELAPLVTEYVQVNYAKANEIASLLIAKGEGKDGAGRILSPRGSVSVDQRTNTLIVKDTAETIDKIQDLVKLNRLLSKLELLQLTILFLMNLVLIGH